MKIILIVFVVFSFMAFFIGFSDGKNADNSKVITVVDDNNSWYLLLGSSLKNQLMPYMLKLKSFVYKEAEIHNPKGDVLPDQIDDQLLSVVKEKIK